MSADLQDSTIRPINEFALAKHEGEYSTWPRTTPLYRNEKLTSTQIPGYSLLRQYAIGGTRYLLITDWDCPYEEAIDLVLLDRELNVIARKQFGVPYSSYWLTGATIVNQGQALELELSECELWTIEVRETKPWLFGSLLKTRKTGTLPAEGRDPG